MTTGADNLSLGTLPDASTSVGLGLLVELLWLPTAGAATIGDNSASVAGLSSFGCDCEGVTSGADNLGSGTPSLISVIVGRELSPVSDGSTGAITGTCGTRASGGVSMGLMVEFLWLSPFGCNVDNLASVCMGASTSVGIGLGEPAAIFWPSTVSCAPGPGTLAFGGFSFGAGVCAVFGVILGPIVGTFGLSAATTLF